MKDPCMECFRVAETPRRQVTGTTESHHLAINRHTETRIDMRSNLHGLARFKKRKTYEHRADV